MESGDSSGTKKQLGKILLQQKLVTPDELEGMLEEQGKRGGKLASVATRVGTITVTEALRALSEQHGVPAIDLSRQVVPLTNLQLIAEEMAREYLVFPVQVHGDQLVLAMATPQHELSVEEVQFVTAKVVFPHIALDEAIHRAIDEAYALHARGEPYYVGERVSDETLAELGVTRPLNADGTLQEFLASDELREPPAARADVQAELEGVVHGRAVMTDGPELDAAFAERPRPSQVPAARGFNDKKVLVVDDDDDVRALLRLTLEHAGIPVIEASTGSAALETIRDQSPDLIVLDAVLPGIHGFDVCRRLHASQRYGQVPIVIVSAIHRGWRLEEDLREAYGVEHVFDKPLDLDRLTRTIAHLLEGKPVPHDDAVLSAAAEAHLTHGMAAFESGDLADAVAHLQAGVDIDPLAFELQYHLGLLYGRSDSLFSAIEALETAIGIAPRHFAALKNLAVVYQRAGFRHKALEIWQRAMANSPDDDTRASIKEHMVTLL